MTVKEYLQQAYKIDRRIKVEKLKLEAMLSAVCGKGISYESDGTQHVPCENGTEKAYAAVMDYRDKIAADICVLVDKRTEIEKVIEAVPDELLREILTRRYLCYQKWELIAVEMNYCVQWVHKLHGTALVKVKEAIESDY